MAEHKRCVGNLEQVVMIRLKIINHSLQMFQFKVKLYFGHPKGLVLKREKVSLRSIVYGNLVFSHDLLAIHILIIFAGLYKPLLNFR